MTATILVVDDEETARLVVSEFLRSKGYEVLDAGTLAEARQYINKGEADIIILDVRLPDGYGPNLLTETARMVNRPQIIIITAHGEIGMAVDAMKNGAQDFIEKPLDLLELEIRPPGRQVVAMRRELNTCARRKPGRRNLSLVTRDEQIIDHAHTAESGISALITGPTVPAVSGAILAKPASVW